MSLLRQLVEMKPPWEANVSRTEMLDLQRRFIEALPDEWSVDIDKHGLVFTRAGWTHVKVTDVSFPFADDDRLTREELIDLVEGHLKDHVTWNNIELHRKTVIEKSKAFGQKIRTSITFDITTDVHNAFLLLLDLQNYTLEELVSNPEEIEGIVDQLLDLTPV